MDQLPELGGKGRAEEAQLTLPTSGLTGKARSFLPPVTAPLPPRGPGSEEGGGLGAADSSGRPRGRGLPSLFQATFPWGRRRAVNPRPTRTRRP